MLFVNLSYPNGDQVTPLLTTLFFGKSPSEKNIIFDFLTELVKNIFFFFIFSLKNDSNVPSTKTPTGILFSLNVSFGGGFIAI